MRAWIQWLAVGSLLVFSGCATLRTREAGGAVPRALFPDEEQAAAALAHYSLALISEATLGAYQGALSHLREASASDPANLTLALRVTAGHLARKEYDQAATVLRRAIAFHPRSVEARLVLAITCQLREDNRTAEREFREAIRLDPSRADSYIRLAALYVAEDRHGKAMAVVDEGLARTGMAAALTDFCDSMGRVYLLGGQPDWAIQCFRRALRKRPDDATLKELLARSQAAAGKPEAAISVLLELAAGQPDNAQIALLLGDLYEGKGDVARAGEQFTRAIRANPGDMTAVLRLANIRFKTQPEMAVKIMEDAVARNSENRTARAYLGLLYSRAGRYADAVKQFAEVETLAKADAAGQKLQAPFYFWYGSACERAGQADEAERLLVRCLELDPEFVPALNYLAYMWADKGVNLDKAMKYVKRALEAEPREGAFLDTLGWIYYRKGDYPAALKYLKMAVRAMPDDPVIREHLGDVWHALGQPGKARRCWREGLELEEKERLAPSKDR